MSRFFYFRLLTLISSRAEVAIFFVIMGVTLLD
jgi:hypothetical protein